MPLASSLISLIFWIIDPKYLNLETCSMTSSLIFIFSSNIPLVCNEYTPSYSYLSVRSKTLYFQCVSKFQAYGQLFPLIPQSRLYPIATKLRNKENIVQLHHVVKVQGSLLNYHNISCWHSYMQWLVKTLYVFKYRIYKGHVLWSTTVWHPVIEPCIKWLPDSLLCYHCSY